MLRRMTVELNDTALMLRYCDGDMAAFETLYARHRGPLFRFILRQSGSHALAEDLFQETWSRIVRARSSYRPSAKFTTYLYRIARNCLIDQYRRAGAQAAVVVDQPTAAAESVAVTDDPVAAAEADDSRALLLQLLAQLPPEQREVFLLRAEAGFTVAEIGALTNTPPETVKSRLRYALTKLRNGVSDTTTTALSATCKPQN